jgi:acetate kinase
MNVLVLNSGSSSIKFQVIDTDSEKISAHTEIVVLRGTIEKIGTEQALVSYCFQDGEMHRAGEELVNHHAALSYVVKILETGAEAAAAAAKGGGVEKVAAHPIKVDAIGHRMVHGGEHFTESHLMDEEVVHGIERAIPLAPLHNPHNLKGYYVCRELFPGLPQVAVFDTAFHHTIPPHAFLYGLPYDYYRRQRIRRYGFHGTSVRYVFYRYRELTGAPKTTSNLIVCHLGNGCSITAIDNGRSVDTSMGFTPLEGLVMGTRCGDIDPAVILHIMGKDELAPAEVSTLLNRWSGLYGLSGESNDMRTLLASMRKGDERSRLAVEVFCYRIRKYIGSYWAVLGRLDAIIFTGGIGENADQVRHMICEKLDALGGQIEEMANAGMVRGKEGRISTSDSKVGLWVIPTNEELLIARDAFRVVNGLPLP